MERLMAHLIEWYEGRFPVWLAPVQLAVLPVDADHHDAAHALAEAARAAGVRAEVVEARHSLGARVRRAHERGVPLVGVLGDREVSDGTVTLRGRDGLRLEPMPPAAVVSGLSDLARRRSRELDLRC
jgi:threonyl-tRNA synthetase